MQGTTRMLVAALVMTVAGCRGGSKPQTMLECGLDYSGQGCLCSAYFNGAPPIDSITCSAQQFPGTLCCAEADFPWSLEHSTGCQCGLTIDGLTPTDCSEIAYGDNLTKQVPACDLNVPQSPDCGAVDTHCMDDSECCSGLTCHPSAFTCSDRAHCPGVGYCGPTADSCYCGLYCLIVGDSNYSCGDGCTRDSDCTDLVNPGTGELYTHCELSLPGYDNICR